jgi:hypothetical protein
MLRRVALVRTKFRRNLAPPPSGRQGDLVFRRSVRRLLVTASVVPSSPILVTLMKEALSSSETSVLTRVTRRNIQEDTILHSHRRENLKSYLGSHQFCVKMSIKPITDTNCRRSSRDNTSWTVQGSTIWVAYETARFIPTKRYSVVLSAQANYTDWATATCRRNLAPTFVDRGVLCGQRGWSPTVVNLSFLERSRYFSFK